jgi:hypothetical protein
VGDSARLLFFWTVLSELMLADDLSNEDASYSSDILACFNDNSSILASSRASYSTIFTSTAVYCEAAFACNSAIRACIDLKLISVSCLNRSIILNGFPSLVLNFSIAWSV